MTLKRIAAVAVVAVIIAAAGFGIYQWRSGSKESGDQSVQTSKVQEGTVAPKLSVTGYVASADERQITSTGSGEIEAVNVSVGDTVTAGQQLIELDNSSAQQTVNLTYANLTSAQTQLQELEDKESSDAQIAAQEAAVAKANVEFQNAVSERDNNTVDSPIDGTVIAVSVGVGDQVSGSSGSSAGSASGESMGLITVADLDNLQVKAAIDQADISKIKVDQAVTVTLDALPDEEFEGVVASIDPIAQTNQNVVTYDTYIALKETDSSMRLGMSADLEIELEKHEDVLYVPNVAVHTTDNQKYVTKMIDGEATEIPVEVGLVSDDRTEIVSGLSKGDDIALQTVSRTSGGDNSGSFDSNPMKGMGRMMNGPQ